MPETRMNEQETRKRKRQRTPNKRTTTAYRISDELWVLLQPLLPVHVNTHRFGGGRPRTPDRQCADAIFYVLRTGCQWQALNQTHLCAHSTAHDRFQEWVETGVFLKLWQAGVEQFDKLCEIDWDWLAMDGAMTKGTTTTRCATSSTNSVLLHIFVPQGYSDRHLENSAANISLSDSACSFVQTRALANKPCPRHFLG